MGNNQTEKAFEEKRLAQTISLAEEQLKQAKEAADKKKSEIIEAKKDVRENTEHGITSLYTSDGFEALVELSQYINPVTDKIIDYEEEEHKILLLEKMIKSPYFARIDFKFDDEDEFEKIYIGRSSLRKNSYQEMYVYDWRSPIASVFYRFMTGEAFYDAPCGRVTGELNLKRQYEIKNGILEYFFDSDVQIVDEFLRQLLSQNTTAKMKAIVETIQHEQDVVIRDMENDLLMVQGVAGSGKTSIALHRAAYLMYQGLQTKLSANNIMIISPNSIFEQYISNVLPELGEDNVISSVFEDILSALLIGRKIQSRNDFLENKYKVYGELIHTYGYDLEEGAKQLEALNYYTNENVKIPLDPTLDAKANAQKYFDKYGKLKRTYEALTDLIEETKSEIDHLESIATSLDIALTEDDLVQIKEELVEYGYIKRKRTDKKAKIKSKPFHYISSDGYHMYVGKNNYQNEELTFKFATGNDWWFHAKGMPGSHVVVKTNNETDLPNRMFEEAGKLAGYYSSGRDSDKIEIDYLQKKNVKKPNGSAPGFVVYYTNFSLTVHPDISGLTLVE